MNGPWGRRIKTVANKLKPYVATLIGKPEVRTQTDLGKDLQELADAMPAHEAALAQEALRVGAHLDKSAAALGCLDDPSHLGAYHAADHVYRKIVGEPYGG